MERWRDGYKRLRRIRRRVRCIGGRRECGTDSGLRMESRLWFAFVGFLSSLRSRLWIVLELQRCALPPCFAKRGCRLLKTKEARGENAAKRGARGGNLLKANGLDEAMKQRKSVKLLTRGSLACCGDAALPRAQKSSGAFAARLGGVSHRLRTLSRIIWRSRMGKSLMRLLFAGVTADGGLKKRVSMKGLQQGTVDFRVSQAKNGC